MSRFTLRVSKQPIPEVRGEPGRLKLSSPTGPASLSPGPTDNLLFTIEAREGCWMSLMQISLISRSARVGYDRYRALRLLHFAAVLSSVPTPSILSMQTSRMSVGAGQ